MQQLIFLLTGIFVFTAFLGQQSGEGISNPFFNYVLFETNFLINHMLSTLTGIIIIVAYQLYSLKDNKKTVLKHKLFFSGYHTLALSIISFFLSFVVLLCIAMIQLNILAVLLAAHSELTGVVTDKISIATALKNNNLPPKIITTEMNSTNEVASVATATTGPDTFYGRSIISTIPSLFIIPIGTPASGMLLIDETLIVTNIIPDELQTVSPLVGNLYVKQYFPIRKIKAYPKIAILNQNNYIVYRHEIVKKQIAQIDREIEIFEKNISSLSATLVLDKESSHQKQDITSSEKIQNIENQLQRYKSYETSYKVQKKLMLLSVEKVPHELGIFIPPDRINITVNSTNPHAIADYFETVVHEYLHYASFVSKQKMLRDSFFEEGLTEYFARQTIKDNVHTSTNLGYPVEVKIINEMTNKIAESDFADVYFTKDQVGLEHIINRVYGDTFYNDNRLLFQTLMFSSDTHQVLKVANQIMKEIGGTPLTTNDIISSYSSL